MMNEFKNFFKVSKKDLYELKEKFSLPDNINYIDENFIIGDGGVQQSSKKRSIKDEC